MSKNDDSDAYGIKRNRKRTRVKTAKGRKPSSTKWLQRQLNDPYVAQARADGYRSRAAYKLLELNDHYNLFKKGSKVIDLGAAPGGWLQVIQKTTGAHIFGIDLIDIEPMEGVTFLHGDFLEQENVDKLLELSGGGFDCVLSDMASATIGHAQTDHIRIVYLCEMALDFAMQTLNENGTFCAKVLQGGTENELLIKMKKHFKSIKHYKPQASRADSAEMYVVATGFKG